MYTIRFDKVAEKFIEKSEKNVTVRILDKIEELKTNPCPKYAVIADQLNIRHIIQVGHI